MNEEGDTPTVAEAVQSTPMVSLNDEIAPNTDNKKSVFQRVGSLIGGKKSKDKTVVESEEDVLKKELDETRRERDRFKAAHLTSESEKRELMTKMECDAKLNSKEIEKLEAKVENESKLKAVEIDNLKVTQEKAEVQWKSLIAKMESEANVKAKEFEYKMEAEVESAMTRMENEIKSKAEEIDNLKRMLEDEMESSKRDSDKLNEKLEANRVEFDQCKRDFDAKKTEMDIEIKLKTNEIECLQKMKIEWKSAMTRMESEIKSKAEEIDKLKKKSEDDAANSKLESDKLTEKLEANRVEFDRYKRDFDAKKTEMDIEINLKAKEIEWLQKMEGEWKSRISQLEKEVETAKNGEKLKISGDVTRGFEKVEKNLRSILDRPTEMTIRARFSNISKLTDQFVYSKPTEFAGVSWDIQLRKIDGHLGVYLRGKNFSSLTWSCAVVADLQLISHRNFKIVVKHHEFYVDEEAQNGEAFGEAKLISFEELLNGDAVKDDSIYVAVVVKAFPSN